MLVHWLVMATLGSPHAAAADLAEGPAVTRVPGRFQADVGVEYRGNTEQGGLREAETRIAERRLTTQSVSLIAAFTPLRGLSVEIEGVVVPRQRLTFSDARTMIFDPVAGQGTYLLGDAPPSTEIRSGSGLGALWFGLAVAPVRWRADRPRQGSWRLDLAVRPPSANRNWWTTTDTRRGAHPGGTGLRLGASFAAKRGIAWPYIRGRWVQSLPLSIDVTDEQGELWVQDLATFSPTTVDTAGGTEVVLLHREIVDVRLDGWVGGQYRSIADVPSGVLLPQVIDRARTIPVTVGDEVAVRGGLAAQVIVMGRWRVRGGIEARYGTPYRVEHVFAAETTPDTLRVGGFINLLTRLGPRE